MSRGSPNIHRQFPVSGHLFMIQPAITPNSPIMPANARSLLILAPLNHPRHIHTQANTTIQANTNNHVANPPNQRYCINQRY